MERKSIHIDEKTHGLLKEFCDENAIKMSPWINLLVLRELKRVGKEPPSPKKILRTT